ncbi:hypothetical protein [Terrabacter sp. Soil810]|uniref:hypothetical protein n=1 Tax=Terrabacter sp. Soil810 TaxID=1736418 RepID=UPI000AEF970A|nr:hypothetical protein [Terrabacter sp. Soil810]
MGPSLEPRGVCIVRVTKDSTGMILTIVSRLDVSRTSLPVEQTCSGVDEGLAVVRCFLDDFDRGNRTG